MNLEYIVFYAATCSVGIWVITRLKSIIHDRDAAIRDGERDRLILRSEVEALRAFLLVDPAPHVHDFTSMRHSFSDHDTTMVFCSIPGCMASQVLQLKDN